MAPHIMRLRELAHDGLAELVAESEREGYRFLRRLAEEWSSGTNRFAAPGEWRTNVSLGGRSEPVAPPPLARTLAVSAAAAIGADLVGIDLLPTTTGYFISELNGAVDFRREYALDGGDVNEQAVLELLRAAADRRALTAVGA